MVSSIDDPRSTGLGLWLLAWIAFFADSYVEALEYSEQSSAVAITPFDRYVPIVAKGCALVLLRRTEEGATVLKEATKPLRWRWLFLFGYGCGPSARRVQSSLRRHKHWNSYA